MLRISLHDIVFVHDTAGETGNVLEAEDDRNSPPNYIVTPWYILEMF